MCRLHATTVFQFWGYSAVAGAKLLAFAKKLVERWKRWHVATFPDVLAVNIVHPRRKHTPAVKSTLVYGQLGRRVENNRAQALAPLGRWGRCHHKTLDKLSILKAIHTGRFEGEIQRYKVKE
jgi:hypothetical protein